MSAPDLEKRLGLSLEDIRAGLDTARQEKESTAAPNPPPAAGISVEAVTKQMGLCPDEWNGLLAKSDDLPITQTLVWKGTSTQDVPPSGATVTVASPSSPFVLNAVGLIGEPVAAVVQSARYSWRTFRGERVGARAYFTGLRHLLELNHGYWSGYRNGKQEVTK